MHTASATPTRMKLDKVAVASLGHIALIERSKRLSSLADWIANFDDFRTVACSRDAVRVACWFVDSWCIAEVRAGRFDPHTLPIVTPTEQQADAAAYFAESVLSATVDSDTRDLAVSAIRLSASRATRMPEAQIVAEAVGLDSIGPVWLAAQISRCASERRSLHSIVENWNRQQEYHYWPRRIDESLLFEPARELARQRLDSLAAQIRELGVQLTGSDVAKAELPR